MSVREFVPGDDATGLKFCIVAAQWNESIVRRLVDGAVATLLARGAAEHDIEVRWLPGSLELPWAAHAAIHERFPGRERTEFRGALVIALGCIIRGETEHFRLVADNTSQGLMRVALEMGVPVLNGNGVYPIKGGNGLEVSLGVDTLATATCGTGANRSAEVYRVAEACRAMLPTVQSPVEWS